MTDKQKFICDVVMLSTEGIVDSMLEDDVYSVEDRHTRERWYASRAVSIAEALADELVRRGHLSDKDFLPVAYVRDQHIGKSSSASLKEGEVLPESPPPHINGVR